MNHGGEKTCAAVLGVMMLLVVASAAVTAPERYRKAGLWPVDAQGIELQGGGSQERMAITAEHDPQLAVDEDMYYRTEIPEVGNWMGEAGYFGERSAWVTSFGKLNVRASADEESEVLGYFLSRQEVTVDGRLEDGFYYAEGKDSYTGEMISGYCFGEYLTFAGLEEPEIVLDIPRYYQADSRWAAKRIGATRKTMEAIGCTTTCMAMSKTWLTGTEVLPDEMCDLLWYDEDGEMGWPKTYFWTTDSTRYLEVMYRMLHREIPVLIGSKRRNGNPHWVLVVGYTGNAEELKAEDFVINDPLTDKRTNLQQFLDEYPRFYKIAYYTGTKQ